MNQAISYLIFTLAFMGVPTLCMVVLAWALNKWGS